MNIITNTRRVVAGFMLIVFAFSITPRVVLHAWFASHKDAAAPKLSSIDNHQIAKSAFHCNCENIVAESPFTEPAGAMQISPLGLFSAVQQIPLPSFYAGCHFFFTLRGPPSGC